MKGVTGDKLLLGADPVHFRVTGEDKTGKTTFALSVFDALQKYGLSPAQVRVVMIDLDGGTRKLVRRGAIPKRYLKSFHYVMCSNWKDVTAGTEYYIPKLRKFRKKVNDLRATWIFVDNDEKAYAWCRDDYSLDAYGMYEHELALEKRKTALSTNRKHLPTYDDRRFDYGIINPKIGSWVDLIHLSGVNYMFLTPLKSFTKKDEDGEEVTKEYPGGWRTLPYLVDDTIKTYLDPDGRHRLDLWKTRSAGVRFRGMTDANYWKVQDFIDKHPSKDKKEKSKKKKVKK